MPSSSNGFELKDFYRCTPKKYFKTKPNGRDDLISLYGLSDIQRSVARFDPVSGEKHKMRKSYKGQIADITCRPEIRKSCTLIPLIMSTMPGYDPKSSSRPKISNLDVNMLESAFDMEKATDDGIPGFNPSTLGLRGTWSDRHSDKAHDHAHLGVSGAEDSLGEKAKKRKRKTKHGVSTPSPSELKRARV